MINYQKKYFKYKNKYLKLLENSQKGGNPRMTVPYTGLGQFGYADPINPVDHSTCDPSVKDWFCTETGLPQTLNLINAIRQNNPQAVDLVSDFPDNVKQVNADLLDTLEQWHHNQLTKPPSKPKQPPPKFPPKPKKQPPPQFPPKPKTQPPKPKTQPPPKFPPKPKKQPPPKFPPKPKKQPSPIPPKQPPTVPSKPKQPPTDPSKPKQPPPISPKPKKPPPISPKPKLCHNDVYDEFFGALSVLGTVMQGYHDEHYTKKYIKKIFDDEVMPFLAICPDSVIKTTDDLQYLRKIQHDYNEIMGPLWKDDITGKVYNKYINNPAVKFNYYDEIELFSIDK